MASWPGDGHAPEVWEKTPGDPVSEVDLAVDMFLRRELSALLPSAGWLSEETIDAPDRLEGGLIWLVDPIDGTRDFVRGRRGWAISVALVSAGKPLIGLLAAPAQSPEQGGQFWYGEAGQGSWRNGARLIASQRKELPGARVPARITPKVQSDLVFVDLPQVESTVTVGEACGEVESTKTVSELYPPVSGRVTEVNQAAVDDPAVITADPYGAGWLFAVQPAAAGDLLTAAEYAEKNGVNA